MLHQTNECQHCATPAYWGEDTNIENVVKFIFLSNSSTNLEVDFEFLLDLEMTTAEQSGRGDYMKFSLKRIGEKIFKDLPTNKRCDELKGR